MPSMTQNSTKPTKKPRKKRYAELDEPRPEPAPDFDFRAEVNRSSADHGTRDRILNGALGLAGEAGEVADLIKKFCFHGRDFDLAALVKELGDVRWYLEHLLITFDLEMQDIERAVVEKLRARYPLGFSTEASIQRRDEAE